MAAHVTIELDVTAPGSPSVVINGGDGTANSRDVTLTLSATGADLAQMKIYGDVDDAFATTEYRALEANAPWITFNGTKSVRLSTGDGVKTVRVKFRDDVDNPTAEATDTITLDTTVPVVTTQAPSATKISKQTGKRTTTFDWTVDIAGTEYKVKVVPATNSTHTAGVQVPTTGGSANVQGVQAIGAGTGLTTTIDGADLESAGAEGNNIVKVFVKNAAGTWSI